MRQQNFFRDEEERQNGNPISFLSWQSTHYSVDTHTHTRCLPQRCKTLSKRVSSSSTTEPGWRRGRITFYTYTYDLRVSAHRKWLWFDGRNFSSFSSLTIKVSSFCRVGNSRQLYTLCLLFLFSAFASALLKWFWNVPTLSSTDRDGRKSKYRDRAMCNLNCVPARSIVRAA